MAALRLGPHQKGVLKWLSLLCKVGGNALAGRALRQLSVKARALGKMQGSLAQLFFPFVERGWFAAQVPKNDGTVLVKWFLQMSKMRAGSLVVKDASKRRVTSAPVKSQWCKRLALGARKRVGDLAKQDEAAVAIEQMPALMEMFEGDWEKVMKDKRQTHDQV